MNLTEAVKIIENENKKKEKNKINVQKNRKKNIIYIKQDDINSNIINNKLLEINNKEIIPLKEKTNKILNYKTLNSYINKIIFIHKSITNKDLNINLMNIFNNTLNNNDIVNIINELYYLNDNILINFLFNKYSNYNTIKTYLIPFSILTSNIKYYKEDTDIYNKIANIIININKDYENKIDDNFVSKNDISKIIGDFREKILYNKSKLLDNDYEKLIFFLYTLIPPRRLEYSNMIIKINNDKFNEEIYNNLDIDHNYIIINNNKSYFIFNNYKTSEYFGKQEFNIELNLYKYIKIYIKKYKKKNDDYLFSLTSNKLGIEINRIFKKIYNENITLRWIRISYTTYIRKKNLTNNELKKISEKMAHSIVTNSRYNKII
jgi:hypothetical protein